eukprot:470829-Prorocentrum_minimum.AAC.10
MLPHRESKREQQQPKEAATPPAYRSYVYFLQGRLTSFLANPYADAKAMAVEFTEYMSTVDFSEYFDSRAAISEKQVTFSLQAVKVHTRGPSPLYSTSIAAPSSVRSRSPSLCKRSSSPGAPLPSTQSRAECRQESNERAVLPCVCV